MITRRKVRAARCGWMILGIGAAACVPPTQHYQETTRLSPTPTSCYRNISADTAVYDTSQITEKPLARSVPPLKYPAETERQKIHGQVLVAVVLGPSGTFDSVAVQQSVHPLLDEEAVRFVRESTLWPACRNGEAVRVRFVVPVTFAAPSDGWPNMGQWFLLGVMGGLMAWILGD